MAPLPGSPAVDAVASANCAVTTDQRGLPRPDEAGDNGFCDIGAVEVRETPPPTGTPSPTVTSSPTSASTPTTTATPSPSNSATTSPTGTATATSTPTNTPVVPTDTSTQAPTGTPSPTSSPTIPPSNTPTSSPSSTSSPMATSTSAPTATPTFLPTMTPTAIVYTPTSTPIPVLSTATSSPIPTGGIGNAPTSTPGTPIVPIPDLPTAAPNLLWSWGGYGAAAVGYDNPSPSMATTITNWVAVAAGYVHNLGLTADGQLWAWGDNSFGELGDGPASYATPTSPVPVNGVSDVVAIAAGADGSVALRGDGTVWTWGRNDLGQLGNGYLSTTGCQCDPVPQQVPGLTDFVSVAARLGYSLGLRSDGTVWAWGNYSYGTYSAPIQVGGLDHIVAIAAGMGGAVALKSDGTVWVQNGLDSWQVGSLSNIVAIAAGSSFGLALGADGTVWAWGDNTVGQLGNGTYIPSSSPVRVQNLSGITAIAAGEFFGLALKSDGTVWSWGDNSYSQLGDGSKCDTSTPYRTNCSSPIPVQVVGLYNTLGMAAGEFQSLVFGSTPAVVMNPSLSMNGYGDTFFSPVGSSSSPQTYAVTNTGVVPLNIQSIIITGTRILPDLLSAPTDFKMIGDSCSGQVLPPDGACRFSISFTPSAVGERGATLQVVDNAPDSPQGGILAGSGAPPTVGANHGEVRREGADGGTA